MAEICKGVVSCESCKSRSSRARRRIMELRRIKYVGETEAENEFVGRRKKSKMDCENSYGNSSGDEKPEGNQVVQDNLGGFVEARVRQEICPKYGVVSVCGRRRDMEDSVTIYPSLCGSKNGVGSELHYFGVYDGHGCSHVATRCGERLHELVKEELENTEGSTEWRNTMERSFSRMDKEVIDWSKTSEGISSNCRCELQSPESDAVGSTAVTTVVTSDKIIVANCGDSRAVLCRGGKAIPLSIDHKPDRPDELSRIQAAGGRVVYWDGPRVLGVLAMSRAIGDNYLKPYVIAEPEVTEMNRTADDDCLILASDGLWDVVSNETACGVARMCLREKSKPCSIEESSCGGGPDKTCSDASMLLTKLALSRRSTDNVSVVVVDLRRDVKYLPKYPKAV